MARTKSSENDTKKHLDIGQIARLKDAIRFTSFGNFTVDNALKYINSGILGQREKKDPNNEPLPVTISRKTYFRYKTEALDIEEIRHELNEFMQKGYVVDLMTVRSVLKESFAMMEQTIFNKDTKPRDKMFVIVNLVRNLPLYTQYLEVLRVLHEKGKLPLGEKKHEEPVAAKD